MKKRILVSTVVVIVVLLFLVYAPVVPFERQETAQGYQSQNCRNNPTCNVRWFKLVWVRGYGSFSYDAFGIGTAPFVQPMIYNVGNVTNVFVFNDTSTLESFAYPGHVSAEPVPLIQVGSATLLTKAVPFGGIALAFALTNEGHDENASVAIYSRLNNLFQNSNPIKIPFGHSGIYNITDWISSPPKQGDKITVTISGSICYRSMCFFYQRIVTIEVGSVV